MECTTLRTAIENAYGVWANGISANPKPVQVSGGPGWIGSDEYEIVATAAGTPSLAQMNGPMLRALLEDRFKLKLHRETKEVSAYALTAAKGGVKMKPTEQGSCVAVDVNQLPPPPAPGQPLPRFCGRPIPGTKGKNMTMDGYGVSMSEFAGGLLSCILDRTVVDKTSLAGNFDFHLEFTPDDTTPLGGPPKPAPPADVNAASIFSVLQEQLGLRLESDKATMDVFVLDYVERPSSN